MHFTLLVFLRNGTYIYNSFNIFLQYIGCYLMVFYSHSEWYTVTSLWKITSQSDFQPKHLVVLYLQGHDHYRMIGGFTTTCAYPHESCEFEPHSWQGVPDTTLCDIVCQWLVTGWWFSPGTAVPPVKKADRHNITEILLKVVLNTITLSM